MGHFLHLVEMIEIQHTYTNEQFKIYSKLKDEAKELKDGFIEGDFNEESLTRDRNHLLSILISLEKKKIINRAQLSYLEELFSSEDKQEFVDETISKEENSNSVGDLAGIAFHMFIAPVGDVPSLEDDLEPLSPEEKENRDSELVLLQSGRKFQWKFSNSSLSF